MMEFGGAKGCAPFCLQAQHPGSRLLGFLNGPRGITHGQYKEITAQEMVPPSPSCLSQGQYPRLKQVGIDTSSYVDISHTAEEFCNPVSAEFCG